MVSRVPAVWLVLIGIFSVQFGAGIAKNVFDDATPTTLVWLRLATSAVLLAAFARPSLRGRTPADWRVAVAFGITLGTMNWSIYQAFFRIPLGIAVTVEFLGPLALAVAGSRRARDLVWAGLAIAGVALLGTEPGRVSWTGIGFALLAGATWAGYILLSASTGRRWPGLDGLAVASVVATLWLMPFLLAFSRRGLGDGRVILAGAAAGVLSSVIPYACDITALRTIPPALFGILMSLEPAAAALAGIVIVGEFLSLVQWVALVCVVVASVGATRSESRVDAPVPN